MLDNSFHRAIQRILNIRRGGSTYGIAPHKPVLLLAIIELFSRNHYSNNLVILNTELKEYFEHYWKLLVHSKHTCQIKAPIFYLQNDLIWKIINQDVEKLNSVKSFSVLIKNQASFKLDSDLFNCLQNSDMIMLLKMVLLDRFFPETKEFLVTKHPMPDYIQEAEHDILKEPQAKYRVITRTEEGFARSWKFRELVKEAYNYTCCISRLNIRPLLQSCHIKPHSMFGNDYIGNGVSLCANLHLAFDNGLISIDQKYRVIVKDFKESRDKEESNYNLQQFHRHPILLPKNERYLPMQEH